MLDYQILDQNFLNSLPFELNEELQKRRASKTVEDSDFLLTLAPYVDQFFMSSGHHSFHSGRHPERSEGSSTEEDLEKILRCAQDDDRGWENNDQKEDSRKDLQKALHFRKNYLQRYISYNTSEKDLDNIDLKAVIKKFTPYEDEKILSSLDDPDLEAYCIWAIHTAEGRDFHKHHKLFRLPSKIDHDHPLKEPYSLEPFKDFSLRDRGLTPLEGLLEAHYCLVCHKREKDTCRQGCPLDQKISQMILSYQEGYVVGALAIAMVDNPMILATGHRICYDCSLACIFKTQTPVDVPGIETQILQSVLGFSDGEQILQTLSFWNPLKNDPFPSPKNGYRVLVVGSGPSGFTLALMLLRKGYEVVMIEALQTFGGVMDYGITPRWDKSLLVKIKNLLELDLKFSFYHSVRFGEMLSLDEALEMGFDHIALCIGAAKPKFIGIEDLPLKGIRMSNDFLMSLQQGEAYKENAATKLNIEFPVVVVGAGLSAVDAAVEALMYGQNRDVSLLYRGKIKDSPSVRQNINEIQEAVDYGVKILDEREILEIKGSNEEVEEIVVRYKPTGEIQRIHAKTILIAAGTEGVDQLHHESISYFGDANPKFRGSVVKAMASVKQGIDALDAKIKQYPPVIHHAHLEESFSSTVEKVTIKGPVLELKIKSPLIAEKACLGQYVKFEVLKQDQLSPLEPIPLRIGRILKEEGCFYLYVHHRGQTSEALFHLKKDQKVSIIGPLGLKIDLPQNQQCYTPQSFFPHDFLCVLKEKLEYLHNEVDHDSDNQPFQWAWDEANEVDAKIVLQSTQAPFMCMMQGLCGQCLTKKGDKLVFGCTQGLCEGGQDLIYGKIRLSQI